MPIPNRQPIGLMLAQLLGTSVRGYLGECEVQEKQTGTTSIEMEWLSSHPDMLSVYRGEWLLIVGQELIAHSADVNEIHKIVERLGITAPFFYYVSTPEEANFVF